ncbi:IS110 family transposase [Spirillospora sp. NPDC049652]
MLQHVWAGVDIGKHHHHVVVIDDAGNRLFSRRVANDEGTLVTMFTEVTALAEEVTWAVDIKTGPAVLLLTTLLTRQQEVLYISGHSVNRVSESYRGEGKTDAKDAAIIADQARMRRGMTPLQADDELIVELQMLVASRQDLVADRTRGINRLRAQLLAVFPALERALDLTNKGPLVLLAHVQTPAALRELGVDRVRELLQGQGVGRSAGDLAARAVEAAQSQRTALPGERIAALLVAELARGVMALNQQIKALEALIADRFRQHELAEVIFSMPGIGLQLGAEFLAATGGDMSRFESADHLAGYAGLAPAPRDSGRISGNLHRPRRYNRMLHRVFYTSAMVSIRCSPESRNFYDRKRGEGKLHIQAVIALARRRVNVLWALLRDQRTYASRPPLPQAA